MSLIYKGYDREGLDRQYDLRSLWPDVPAVIDRRENESARVRERINGRLDIAYGESAGERLDIFPPSNSRNGGPALIYIHGGYWQLSDKNDTTYIAPAFLDAGINFITLNYTLAPAATLDDMVRQCRQAVAWIWHHAAEIGINRDRLHLAGHSAGGHLTAMMLATDWTKFDRGLPPDPIAGACALSGLYDLEPIRLCFVNDVLGLEADAVIRNSPLYLDPLLNIPVILSVGENETDEFKRHQKELFSAWSAKGLAVEQILAPDCHHYTIVEHFGDPNGELHRAMIEMMRED